MRRSIGTKSKTPPCSGAPDASFWKSKGIGFLAEQPASEDSPYGHQSGCEQAQAFWFRDRDLRAAHFDAAISRCQLAFRLNELLRGVAGGGAAVPECALDCAAERVDQLGLIHAGQ